MGPWPTSPSSAAMRCTCRSRTDHLTSWSMSRRRMPMAMTPTFLREVRRVLHPQGRFLYADYRTRRKVARLEQMASTAGLTGELRDITINVVSACELDAERRRRIIRGGLPWYCRPMLRQQPRRLLGPAGNAELRALSRRRQNVLPDLHVSLPARRVILGQAREDAEHDRGRRDPSARQRRVRWQLAPIRGRGAPAGRRPQAPAIADGPDLDRLNLIPNWQRPARAPVPGVGRPVRGPLPFLVTVRASSNDPALVRSGRRPRRVARRGRWSRDLSALGCVLA